MIDFKDAQKNYEKTGGMSASVFKSLFTIHMNFHTKSDRQSGGVTGGKVNASRINTNAIDNRTIWRGRAEGFISGLGIAIIVEVVKYLIVK